MLNGIFQAHSGLRFLILLVGIIAAIYFAIAIATGRDSTKGDRILLSAFVGLLDLQALLGIVLMAMGIFYGALIGHLGMMVAAVATAHGLSVFSRKQADPSKARQMRLIAVVLPLLLIAAGITAIGRGIFQTGAPSM